MDRVVRYALVTRVHRGKNERSSHGLVGDSMGVRPISHPGLTVFAALGLVVVMVGAVIWHAGRGEPISIATNVFNAALMGYVAYGRGKLAPLTARSEEPANVLIHVDTGKATPPFRIHLSPAPVAQGIEHRSPEPGAQVRVLPGALAR